MCDIGRHTQKKHVFPNNNDASLQSQYIDGIISVSQSVNSTEFAYQSDVHLHTFDCFLNVNVMNEIK